MKERRRLIVGRYVPLESITMEGLICIAVLGVTSFFVIIIIIGFARDKQKALDVAHAAYQESLAQLKASPTDPNLRQLALDAGRTYASLSRENNKVAIFDEVALKNDLDATTAGAVSITASVPPATSVADRLRQLDDLRNQGLVTDEEYQTRRAKILDEV